MEKRELWLSLFASKTAEELAALAALDVPEITQAVQEYGDVVTSPVFKEAQRLRSRTRHNEASALDYARKVAIAENEAKRKAVIAEKDAAIADIDRAIAEREAAIADTNKILADKDAAIADKNAQLARLRALHGDSVQ